MDNATKIQHLKEGIKLDTGLEHFLITTRINKLVQVDFGLCVSFYSAEVNSSFFLSKTVQLLALSYGYWSARRILWRKKRR